MQRRLFVGSIIYPALGSLGVAAFPRLARGGPQAIRDLSRQSGPSQEIAKDESFWFEVQQAFTVDRSLINLNNGGVSPSPAIVQEAMKRHLDYSNTAPTHAMWRVLEPQREGVRQRLAAAFGSEPDEVAITRNASESLRSASSASTSKRATRS